MTPPPPTLDSVPTPAAVVDLDRLEANLARMQDYANRHGLGLRPHAKTHKARWLAEAQVARGAIGVTVATPVEAARLGGVAPELLIAYPLLGSRAEEGVRAATVGPTLVGLDSVESVRVLQRAMTAGRMPAAGAADGSADGSAGLSEIGVLVEADVGMRRCGVAGPAEAVAVARACGDGVVYRGLMFYPGHIREPVERQDRMLEALARDLDVLVRALGDAGFVPEIVSGGSTPTAFRSHEVPHQTEIRPGTYVFNDRTTAAVGACGWDDCAYTVVATVVSTAVAGQAVIDAGSKALSSDVIRASDRDGYGQLLDRPEVVVARLSEEHGVLDLSGTDWRPRVGERVRVIPNHVCVSVNLQSVVYGIGGGVVERSWPVEAKGWRGPGRRTPTG